MLNKMLRWTGYGISVIALVASAALLLSDAKRWSHPGLSAAVVSSAPLLLVGVAFLLMQPILRPRPADLLKNVLLAGTFLLWGAIQLMPQNALAARLGSLVIVLYVVDLAWVILGSANATSRN
jgi:hypothetical protein